jgi:2-amino-4-hydroxy-6-hydroxymethyldihydropteridine diphosphokinase
MPEVFVGLGSNIAPEAHLKIAMSALTGRYGTLGSSSVYRSPPFGFAGDDFLNLVVRFETRLEAAVVEADLTAIERDGGRDAVRRAGSRTLDLDLLVYGQCVDAALRLPRDDVLRYAFVLRPLVELSPVLRHPVTGVSMAAAWRVLGAAGGRLERLGPPDIL